MTTLYDFHDVYVMQAFCRRSVRAGSTCTGRVGSSRWLAVTRNWTRVSATRRRSAAACWSASIHRSSTGRSPDDRPSNENHCFAAPPSSVVSLLAYSARSLTLYIHSPIYIHTYIYTVFCQRKTVERDSVKPVLWYRAYLTVIYECSWKGLGNR